jgi:transcriptional regulator with XRE-family HTH domain
MPTVAEQLKKRRLEMNIVLEDLANATLIAPGAISQILNGKRDARLSSCESLAAAMNANLMVIPYHLMPEVNRLLSGQAIGPDDVPTAAEMILRGEN